MSHGSLLKDCITSTFILLERIIRNKIYNKRDLILTRSSVAASFRTKKLSVMIFSCMVSISNLAFDVLFCEVSLQDLNGLHYGTKTMLVSANVGDSRAVLSRGGMAMALTKDHKTNDPNEKRELRN